MHSRIASRHGSSLVVLRLITHVSTPPDLFPTLYLMHIHSHAHINSNSSPTKIDAPSLPNLPSHTVTPFDSAYHPPVRMQAPHQAFLLGKPPLPVPYSKACQGCTAQVSPATAIAIATLTGLHPAEIHHHVRPELTLDSGSPLCYCFEMHNACFLHRTPTMILHHCTVS